MPSFTARAAALLALALLAACTGPSADTGSPAPSPTPSSAAPVTTSTAKKNLTAQGFLSKNVGELGGTECKNSLDTCAIKFTVDKIEVNPKCYEYGTPAPAGRKTLLLHVSLTTGNLSPNAQGLAPTIFNPFSLKGLAADGFVHDAQPGSCVDYKGRLSDTILSNSRYAGTVEVDVPDTATSVASAWPTPGPEGSRGWVWPIG